MMLIGFLGRDPELKRTPQGAAVCEFSVATTEKWKSKDGSQQQETEWHNCVAWNKQAETLAQYLSKGSHVYIEGKLKTKSWEDNGVKKYRTEVMVKEFQFLSGKQDTGNSNNGGFGGGGGNSGYDDELAF